MSYADITCDPFDHSTILNRTAGGMLDALTVATGVEVYSADMDTAIIANGGLPGYKCAATKALRNVGYAVITAKARQNSWYKLAGTAAEYEQFRRSVVRELYSRQISTCRALAAATLAAPRDRKLADYFDQSRIMAVSLGRDSALGKTMSQVMAEADPIPT